MSLDHSRPEQVAKVVENFLTETNLRKFVDDFFADVLEPTLMSEEPAAAVEAAATTGEESSGVSEDAVAGDSSGAGGGSDIVKLIGTTFDSM